jgi:hypothetical protein
MINIYSGNEEEVINIMHNPFYYGGSIKESRLFIGRKREVSEICEAIYASASVSVVGERRVGKSSLLQYLADPSVEAKNGLNPAQYIFAYFDFLGYPTITPAGLWQRLLAEMVSQLGDSTLAEQVKELSAQDTIVLADLERLLKGFEKAKLNLVILFDEFDTAAGNPNFDQAFFGGLRNLSKYPLSYIIASHRTLSDLQFAHPDALVSPFFNIFRRVTLGSFTADDIETLLTTSLEGTDITFNDDDRAMLEAVAASHPFFLQMAAYFLFNAYRYGHRRKGRVDYRWVEERMRDNAVEHFRYYWDGSEIGESLILATLALLEPKELKRYQLYPSEDDPMLRRLRDRVLVAADPTGKPRIFSTLFSQWLVETISFIPVEQVDDFKAAIEQAKIRGFQKAWLDTKQRIRQGFAWIDARAIVKWLVVDKGAESLSDWVAKLLQLTKS